jgi:hypothetical protein
MSWQLLAAGAGVTQRDEATQTAIITRLVSSAAATPRHGGP